jgi:hypothetical protein
VHPDPVLLHLRLQERQLPLHLVRPPDLEANVMISTILYARFFIFKKQGF